MQLHKRCEMCDSKYKRGVWMGPSFLALLTMPSLTTPTAAQVWPISENDDHPSEPVTTLVMNTERLEENAHGTFALEGVSQNETTSTRIRVGRHLHLSWIRWIVGVLGYILLCIGVVWIGSAILLYMALAYQCRWIDAQGSIATNFRRTRWTTSVEGSNLLLLYFARDFEGSKLLAHVLSDSAREWKSQHQNRIRKEVYALALLVAVGNALKLSSGCQEPSSLMVSSKCVTFPVVSSVVCV